MLARRRKNSKTRNHLQFQINNVIKSTSCVVPSNDQTLDKRHRRIDD